MCRLVQGRPERRHPIGKHVPRFVLGSTHYIEVLAVALGVLGWVSYLSGRGLLTERPRASDYVEIVGGNHSTTWDNEAVFDRFLKPLTREEVGTMILYGRQLMRGGSL